MDNLIQADLPFSPSTPRRPRQVIRHNRFKNNPSRDIILQSVWKKEIKPSLRRHILTFMASGDWIHWHDFCQLYGAYPSGLVLDFLKVKGRIERREKYHVPFGELTDPYQYPSPGNYRGFQYEYRLLLTQIQP